MSYEGRDIAEVVEGYISVTGGNIWYKIVGANRKRSLFWYCTVTLVHLTTTLRPLKL
ncbi:MAG TPA: hypothetical protein VN414_05970 [Methanosarcina sp.]|nr:hypothetical protein [Methanosarcina sp.]